jgi:NAD-dependent SIR2 family protein deacetylase
MAYAKGTHALAVCDRCGWSYPYLSMKVEWNNLKVCPECYEPRQPQDTPARITADPETLYQARPEVSLPQSQLGVVKTENPSSTVIEANGTNSMTFTDDPIGTYFTGLEGTSELGTITVTIS